MDERQIHAIVKAAIKETFDEEIKPFYIDRERHYQDHLFITDMREWISSIHNTTTKTIVGILITAGLSLLVLGFIFWGKNHWGK